MGTEVCRAVMLRQEAKLREMESEIAMLRAANDEASVDEQQIIDAPSELGSPFAIEQPPTDDEPRESPPPQVLTGLGAGPAYPRPMDPEVEAPSPPEAARLGQEASSTQDLQDPQKIIHSLDDMMKALKMEIERKPRLLHFGQQAVSTMAGQYRMLYGEPDKND